MKRRMQQSGRTASPWPLRTRLKVLLWNVVALALFRPTPKPMYRWRTFLLRLFGSKVSGVPYVDASTRIKMPWNLTLEDGACLGPHSEVYNLGLIWLGERATVAQHVYLCGGTHDFAEAGLPLIVGDIIIGPDTFIGVKALVLPGVTIGEGAVIGAGAVVTQDMPTWTVCAGNPCRSIKPRRYEGRSPAGDALTGAPSTMQGIRVETTGTPE